jgi:hypothetical protein
MHTHDRASGPLSEGRLSLAILELLITTACSSTRDAAVASTAVRYGSKDNG